MNEQINFLYAGYIQKLAKRFDQALSEIETIHNFEYGSEFEVAICKVLRRVLPHKYGICRGYVVDETGETAGDDIIIFDKISFPTLRSLEEDYSVKEHVPIDAVYAYIEAKHTLDLSGDGDSSLARASEQASKVKSLCNHRSPVSLQVLGGGVTLGPTLKVEVGHGWPKIRNPMFAGIMSRRLRIDGRILDDPKEAHSVLRTVELPSEANGPDLIVAGRNNLIIPAVKENNMDAFIISGFYLHNESTYVIYKAPGISLAIGLSSLLWAIDWIQLERMPWQRIIANALGKL